jgi:autotransporter-associated beta strand protein
VTSRFRGTGVWGNAANWNNQPVVTQFPNNGNGGSTYDAIVDSGTATLDRDITIEKFTLDNATLTSGNFNAPVLTVRDTFTWSGGSIVGTGTTQANGGAILGTSAFSLLTLSGRTLNLAAGKSATLSGSLDLTGGAIVNNSGALTLPAAASIGNDPAGGAFNNFGSFTTSTAGGVGVAVPFQNSGAVVVPAFPASLSLTAGGTHTGTFGVAAGGTLSFAGNHTFQTASSVTGAGNVSFGVGAGAAGTANIAGAYNVSGSTFLIGGTVAFAAPATTGTLSVSAGTINGVRDLSATSLINEGGTIRTSSGTLTAGDATLRGGATTVETGGRLLAGALSVSAGTNAVQAGGRIGLGTAALLRAPAQASGLALGEPEVLTFTGTLSPTVMLNAHATTPGTIVLGGDVVCSVPSGTARITSVGVPPIAGTVDLNADVRTFSVGPGSAAVDLEVSARLTNGGLRKGGPGTLRLTGLSDYAGGTTVGGGALEVAHPSALGTGPVTFESGQLNLRGTAADTTFPNPLNAAPAVSMTLDIGRDGGGAATVRVPSATLGAALNVTSATASTLVVTGPVTLRANATINNSAAVTLSGPIGGGAFGFTKTLGGTLTLSGTMPNNFIGETVVNEGEVVLSKPAGILSVPGNLRINGPGSVRLTGHNQVASNAAVVVNGAVQNATWNLNGQAQTVASLDNTGTVQTGGGGALTVGPVTGGTGALTVAAGGGSLTADYVRQGTLTVGGTATVRPRASGGGTSAVKFLVIAGNTDAWTGKLNLNDTALIVDYTGTSALPTISNQIRRGYAGGLWNGNGITSTSAGSTSGAALGYAEASAVLGAAGGTFRGQPADGTAVLVRYTLFGDANLDGFVNGTDFALLAGNFGQSNRYWNSGDFNYDLVVNGSDFALLAGNFGKTVPGGAGVGLSAGDWESLESFGAAVGVPVPEPTAVGLLVAACVGGLRRRRRL